MIGEEKTENITKGKYYDEKISNLNIYTEVSSVCLSNCLLVCPIITYEPPDRFTSNTERGTRLN